MGKRSGSKRLTTPDGFNKDRAVLIAGLDPRKDSWAQEALIRAGLDKDKINTRVFGLVLAALSFDGHIPKKHYPQFKRMLAYLDGLSEFDWIRFA